MFNGKIYIESDRVAMIFSLGPLLKSIFITSLEEKVILKLTPYLNNWKRNVNSHTTHTPMLIPKMLISF